MWIFAYDQDGLGLRVFSICVSQKNISNESCGQQVVVFQLLPPLIHMHLSLLNTIERLQQQTITLLLAFVCKHIFPRPLHVL